MNENPQITPLPHGLKTESTLSQLSPGSNRILVAMSNYSDQDITIPDKTIISQLSLGNKVPKMNQRNIFLPLVIKLVINLILLKLRILVQI